MSNLCFFSVHRLLLALMVFAACFVNCVSAQKVLLDYSSTWRFNTNGLSLGTAWREPAYDDSTWPSGRGVFSTPNEPLLQGATIGTQLTNRTTTRFITNFYFRTTFVLTELSPSTLLILSNQIDDGAVFYLNGVEIGRFGMPAASPTANTFATRANEITDYGVDVLIITNAAVVGTNVLAVEVHQGNNGSSDSAFGSKLVALPTFLIPAPPARLIDLTNHLWRYDESGIDRGTTWRDASFDDTTWPEGRGVFALETAAAVTFRTNTILKLTNSAGARVNTHYFRTRFQFTNDPGAVSLISSNMFDDGAVVYLNGAELYRYNMPTGPITASTFAITDSQPEGVIGVTNIASARILPGENVLAIEIHQNSVVSLDVVMGFALTVMHLPPLPLVIEQQPADVTVSEGTDIALQLRLNSLSTIQWFKDAVPISGATGETLRVNNTLARDSGLYAAVATNLLGGVTSRLAHVQVIPDTIPPRLLSADALDATHILLTFSETLTPQSVATLSAYAISNTVGTTLQVFSATITNGTNVLLTTAPRPDAGNFLVTVSGLQDVSPGHLEIAPGSTVPLGWASTLIPWHARWQFLDPVPPFDDPAPPSNWTSPDALIPETWGESEAGFYSGQVSLYGAAVPLTTPLTTSPAVSSFFRHVFDLKESRSNLELTADLAFEDGLVLYLNGLEVFRANLPAGPVTHLTLARTNSPQPLAVATNVTISPSSLRPGLNVLAAELHQAETNDVDKIFALQLRARAESTVGGLIILAGGPSDMTAVEGKPVAFTVSQAGAEWFQWHVDGTNFPGAINPVFTVVSGLDWDGARISVTLSNSSQVLTSSEATLRVIPDVTPPAILSAIASNNVIVVTFSEPVFPGTATNVLNYLLHDPNGSVIAIDSAIMQGDSNVLLKLSTPVFVGTLMVSNVVDLAATPNVILPTLVDLGFEFPIVMASSTWRYLQSSPNTMWKQTDYDASAWPIGPGLFYGTENGTPPKLPEPIGTPLSITGSSGQYLYTSYFRREVVMPAGFTAEARLRFIIDDGAVFYLNGSELLRHRMPSGILNYTTSASGSVGTPDYEGPFTYTLSFLPGTNTFAAEVHQSGSSSADLAFAAEIILYRPFRVLNSQPEKLRWNKWGDQIALEKPAGTNDWQHAENVAGPWNTITNAPNPLFVSPTGHAGFYRLQP